VISPGSENCYVTASPPPNGVYNYPQEGFKPSTISSDRTVIRQFVDYLKLQPFEYLQIDDMGLDFEKPGLVSFLG